MRNNKDTTYRTNKRPPD